MRSVSDLPHSRVPLQLHRSRLTGRLVRAGGGRLEVSGLKAGVGARCQIDRIGNTPLNAEVIGFEGEHLLLACDDSTAGVNAWRVSSD